MNNSSVTPKCHISEIFPLYHQPRIQQSTEPLTTVHGENNDKPSNFPCSADFADHERPTLANLAFMLYLLLLAVAMVGSGFKWATGDQAKVLFEFASHPIAGLMIGLVATALIQSSSTVTSIIVGLVAVGYRLKPRFLW